MSARYDHFYHMLPVYSTVVRFLAGLHCHCLHASGARVAIARSFHYQSFKICYAEARRCHRHYGRAVASRFSMESDTPANWGWLSWAHSTCGNQRRPDSASNLSRAKVLHPCLHISVKSSEMKSTESFNHKILRRSPEKKARSRTKH